MKFIELLYLKPNDINGHQAFFHSYEKIKLFLENNKGYELLCFTEYEY